MKYLSFSLCLIRPEFGLSSWLPFGFDGLLWSRLQLVILIIVLNCFLRTSLVMQWLRICLPIQGAWVQSLVLEEPTCCGATKPMCHNYWACALEPASHNYWSPHALEPTRCNYWAHAPQLLKPAHSRARAPQQEKPPQWEVHAPQRRAAPAPCN